MILASIALASADSVGTCDLSSIKSNDRRQIDIVPKVDEWSFQWFCVDRGEVYGAGTVDFLCQGSTGGNLLFDNFFFFERRHLILSQF